jgi:formylglycine-generating enzyme required for sulfatase activity
MWKLFLGFASFLLLVAHSGQSSTYGQGVSASARPSKPLTAAEEGALKPKDGFRECDDCPEMVVVPAGSFTMGSPDGEAQWSGYDGREGPQHRVTISRPFSVGKFPVTRGEFATFAAQTGHRMDGRCYAWSGKAGNSPSDRSWRSPGFDQTDRHPVVCVNWDDAKTYAAWLSTRTGRSYRLLTEAEREYVTRAGTTTPFWWGASISTDQANYNGDLTYGSSAKGEYRRKTLPVDSFAPNPWGLYQVHGNVYEWVEDCWNGSYQNAPTDGSAWTTGECDHRVLRGGSWDGSPRVLRAAVRLTHSSVRRNNYAGFRLARTLGP